MKILVFFNILFQDAVFRPSAMRVVRKTDWTRVFADQRATGGMGPCGPILPLPLEQIPDVQHAIGVFSANLHLKISFAGYGAEGAAPSFSRSYPYWKME
jgi:hypothetical protein